MIALMQSVAEAVMSKGVRGLLDMVPGGAYLYDVANDALRRLRDRKRADQLRDEVVTAASAALDEVKQAAKKVAQEVAGDAPIEDRIALEMYLTQIPGAVRQSLKRADDPSGKTVPPNFALHEATDLLARLPQRAARFRPDEPLPGKPGWRLVELLGAGGFGEVWLARNPALSALKGAVKFGLDPRARDRLLRHEGALVNRVMEQGRHPNVVQLLDAHLDGDAPWLMYEYVPGGDLTGLILAWQALPPADRAARTAEALRTLAAAVGHFHRLGAPLVHRDLKPANILLAGDRSQETGIRKSANSSLSPDSCLLTPDLKIADFGIGGVAAATALSYTATAGRPGSTGFLMSQLAGSYTPLYASPQQQAGAAPDPRDDVHALGVIGFQMITGKLDATLGADYAKTLRKLAVPEGLIELLGDCAAHDPDNRPRDCAELAERLTKLTAPTPTPASAPAPVPAPPPPAPPVEPQPFPALHVGDGVLPDVETTKCPKCAARLRLPRLAHDRERILCPRCKTVFKFTPPAPKADAPEARPVAKPVPPSGDSRPRERAPVPVPPLPQQPARHEVPHRTRSLLLLFALGLPIGLGIAGVVYVFTSVSDRPFATATHLDRSNPSGDWKKAEFKKTIPAKNLKAGTLRVSPDGTLAGAMGLSDPLAVNVWRLSDGAPVTKNPMGTYVFGFSPDSQRLAIGINGSGDVQVVSALSGTELFTLTNPFGIVALRMVEYSPDGHSLLVSDQFNVWAADIRNPKSAVTKLQTGRGEPFGDGRVVFAPSGSSFAIVGARTAPNSLFTLDGFKFEREVGTKDDKFAVFATTGDRIVTWDGKTASVWETKTGKPAGNHNTDCGVPQQLLLAADNRRLVTVGDKAALIWELGSGTTGAQIAGHDTKIVRAAFNPSGSVLVTADEKGSIRVREMTFPNATGDEVTGHTGKIFDLQFTPDGNTLVAAGEDGIFVWSVPNPKRWW